MPLTTRIAPSPTGDFHIGSARTAYFNWLAARATGGRFILRIDDTDAARNDEAAVGVIHDALDWLGLAPDLVLRQSERLPLYRDVAADLMARGRAEKGSNGAIYMKGGAAVPWTDRITGAQAPSKEAASIIANQVLLRANGTPVYHFASTVDDLDLGVDLVIRGMDHLTNTHRHASIAEAIGTPFPDCAHVGLITQGGKKLSKREGAASLLGYRDAGVHPQAMLNFLLRLGWGPARDDKSMALIDRDRAVELFMDHGRMKASPAGMDPAKLASFDRKYKARDERRVEPG